MKNQSNKKILDIFSSIANEEQWEENSLNKILRKYKKDDGTLFRNDELVKYFKELTKNKAISEEKKVKERIRLRPTRSNSGVTVVTVLTKPFPCPGNCIYCPNDPLMPKSYISSEPGAQRALASKFVPYAQVFNRLVALNNVGHNIEKIELLILGGTWSAYPESYQIWFVNECFRAMNDMTEDITEYVTPQEDSYNETDWDILEHSHTINEKAYCRNVGLVLETRPDYISEEEVLRMRRLGATKIQLGIQSLDDEILRLNGIGRTVEDTEQAFSLLRRAGFKIHGHWMPNLYGSTVEKDIDDYKLLWSDRFSPDELKIYPTSVIPNTPLHTLYKEKKYVPYTEEELINVLCRTIPSTPRYCRLSRIIRDIPSEEIVAGNKRTNLRQIVEDRLREKGIKIQDIRSREIRGQEIILSEIEEEEIKYNTTVSTEYFLSYRSKKDDRLCGFLRLSIPKRKHMKDNFVTELNDSSVIREIHVYGKVVGIHENAKGASQHLGLGRRLVSRAEEITKEEGIRKISVISAIGTREYYRKLGYNKENLYMSKFL